MIPSVISIASRESEGILTPKLRRVAISHVDKGTRIFLDVITPCNQIDDMIDRTGQTSAV